MMTLALLALVTFEAHAQRTKAQAIYDEMVTNLKIDTVNIHDTQRLIQAALLEPDLCFHGNPHPTPMDAFDPETSKMRTPIAKLRKALARYEAEYEKDKKHYGKLLRDALLKEKAEAGKTAKE
ncbi:MAG: hypothetical protein JSS75_01540 [Bacteroidetes bacterium]|nr:hypothetical protein [Bacteroidota bacterium]